MLTALIESPLLLLFVVAGIGYGVGSLKVLGTNLGVAAVLFVGLAFGALSPDLHVPDIIIFLGLTIFVYTIGLSSGPAFFATFRQRGTRDITFVASMLVFSAILTVGIHYLFGFEKSITAGLFAGSFTNTPSLAGLLDAISNTPWPEERIQVESERGVIGYSLSYPMGVLGVMIAIKVVQTLFRVDYQKEEALLSREYPVKRKINSKTIEITKERAINKTIRDLKKEFEIDAVFGRVQFSNGETELTAWDTKFSIGDQVALVGSKEEIERVGAVLGKIMPYQLSFDRSEYDTRRIFVSNPKVAGQKLATLSLNERFSAIITRVRRGDIDLLANSSTVLELGDRVRFVARRKDVPSIAKFFGDSYDALSKINLLSFGLGMALGIWLGMITFQFPGDVSFKLGFAGGPLIVALTLGGLRRTGPIVWTLPYSANLTLRQVGLILMLAGIGINSGHTFAATIFQVEGAYIFAAATMLAMTTTLSTLIMGYKVLKIPFSFLLGMVASQPAVLDYAFDQTKNKLPSIGYTLVLPVTLIGKIIIVQILFALL